MKTLRLIEMEGPCYAVQKRRLWWWAFISQYSPESTWATRKMIWRFCIIDSLTEANEAMERAMRHYGRNKKKPIPKIVKVIKEVKPRPARIAG